MQDPEDSIDQSTLLTFQEERQWLRSYSDQLQNFSSNLSHPQPLESFQMFSNPFESLAKSLQQEVDSLKEELNLKQLKLEDLSVKLINEEIFQDSWKKLLEKETESIRVKMLQQEALIEELRLKVTQLTQEEKNKDHENEVSCLNTKIVLMTDEFKALEAVIREKDKEISILNEKIEQVEAEKCKALSLFSMKEQRIREEIESSYSFVDLTQQVDYYSKKMKEFQHLYLEQKSYEDKILQVLARNRELEALNDSQGHQLSQALTAFSHLKQDYELITIKHKSLNQLNSSLSAALDKEVKTTQQLSLEKSLLQSQVSSFLKATSSGIFSFNSAEELIIQNTRINSKLAENEKIIKELKEKNFELIRRLETFEHPKDVPFIENEEIPEISNDFEGSREKFIENLAVKNLKLLEENEYLMQRQRLSELKERETANLIEELQEIVKNLEQKLENCQIIDFTRIDHERYEKEIRELEGNLEANQGIVEDLKKVSKKMKENFEEVDGRLQEKEYQQVCSLVEWKNTQDELIRKIEGLEIEGINLRKLLKELELRSEGQISANLIEMEIIRGRNQKLEADYLDLQRKNILNEISLQETVNQLKNELQDERMKRSEKEHLKESLGKITYLVYKALKRPNDFEDARG